MSDLVKRLKFNTELNLVLNLEAAIEIESLQNDLEVCCSVAVDMQERMDRLVATLDKLARLGNEPHYGNSIGNDIAIKALEDQV